MVKAKKFYTHITQIDLLMAQQDMEHAQKILDKLEPFLKYLSFIIYDFYGAKYDRSLDKDDIMQFLRMSVLKAISSYDPSKYLPEKDKSGSKSYLDGFRYISTMAKRFVKYWHNYHHRDKRIPPEMLTTLEPDFYITSDDKQYEPSQLDLVLEVILEKFKNTYMNGIHVYDVMKLLFEGYSHKRIAKELDTKEDIILDIIEKGIKEKGAMFQSELPLLLYKIKKERV